MCGGREEVWGGGGGDKMGAEHPLPGKDGVTRVAVYKRVSSHLPLPMPKWGWDVTGSGIPFPL